VRGIVGRVDVITTETEAVLWLDVAVIAADGIACIQGLGPGVADHSGKIQGKAPDQFDPQPVVVAVAVSLYDLKPSKFGESSWGKDIGGSRKGRVHILQGLQLFVDGATVADYVLELVQAETELIYLVPRTAGARTTGYPLYRPGRPDWFRCRRWPADRRSGSHFRPNRCIIRLLEV